MHVQNTFVGFDVIGVNDGEEEGAARCKQLIVYVKAWTPTVAT